MILKVKNKLFIFGILLLCACNTKSNVRTSNREISSDSSNVVGLSLWKDGKINDTATYLRIGNPDTSLALFYHLNLDTVNYDAFIEYCRLCEEEDKIFKIYRQLFDEEKDVEEQITTIRKIREEIVDSTRSYLISDFKTYGYDSGSPEADWLIFKCKDSKIIQSLKQLLKSGKLSDKDKEKIENDLLLIKKVGW